MVTSDWSEGGSVNPATQDRPGSSEPSTVSGKSLRNASTLALFSHLLRLPMTTGWGPKS